MVEHHRCKITKWLKDTQIMTQFNIQTLKPFDTDNCSFHTFNPLICAYFSLLILAMIPELPLKPNFTKKELCENILE